MRVLLTLLVLLALPATASASSYYLSPSGSGTTCSLASPCKSVLTASSKMAGGDTLFLRGGTYTVSGSLSGGYSDWHLPSGTSGAPTIVKAYPGETPVFDGGNTSGYWWIPSGKSYITIDGLTLQNWNDAFGDGVIQPSGGSNHLEIKNNRFLHNGGTTDNDHDIYIGGDGSSPPAGNGSNVVHDISIHNNWFEDGPGGALHMWHYQEGYNVAFFNNVVLNKHVGMYVCDGAANVHITNNTIVNTNSSDTTSEGIRTGCGEKAVAQSVYVRNNIFYKNYGVMWNTRGSATTEVEDHNIFYGSATRTWTLGTGSSSSDPQFVNLSTKDFHLQSTSPAINMGTSTDSPSLPWTTLPPSDDFAYGARSGAPDAGAYENGAGGGADTTPPTTPTNLQATSPSCTSGSCVIHVTWTAATDNVGVDHYNEFRPLGTNVGTDPGTATATDFGGSLPTCSSQTMGLQAQDAAGNVSTVAQITASTYCPTTTLTPAADTYVDVASPASNFNTATTLKAYGDGSASSFPPGARMLLRFDSIPAGATSMTLRLNMSASSSQALQVKSIDQGCGWTSSTVTWNTRPDMGTTVYGSKTSLTSGWNDFTLTGFPTTGGSFCVYVAKNPTGVVTASSKEGANAPQLVVG